MCSARAPPHKDSPAQREQRWERRSAQLMNYVTQCRMRQHAVSDLRTERDVVDAARHAIAETSGFSGESVMKNGYALGRNLKVMANDERNRNSVLETLAGRILVEQDF